MSARHGSCSSGHSTTVIPTETHSDNNAISKNIRVIELSAREPKLKALELVNNGSNFWKFTFRYDAAFTREFKKLAKQDPDPENIKSWFVETGRANPKKLNNILAKYAR